MLTNALKLNESYISALLNNESYQVLNCDDVVDAKVYGLVEFVLGTGDI